jgi:hypothetical protein
MCAAIEKTDSIAAGYSRGTTRATLANATHEWETLYAVFDKFVASFKIIAALRRNSEIASRFIHAKYLRKTAWLSQNDTGNDTQPLQSSPSTPVNSNPYDTSDSSLKSNANINEKYLAQRFDFAN